MVEKLLSLAGIIASAMAYRELNGTANAMRAIACARHAEQMMTAAPSQERRGNGPKQWVA
jgi:hypothetical protein